MYRLALEPAERHTIDQIIADLERESLPTDSEDFLEKAFVAAHDVPIRVRNILNAFRMERLPGSLILSGHQIDQEALGSTPVHWQDPPDCIPARKVERLLILYASLLGDAFGWATQQDGKLIHDVLPIQGHEHEQLGSSSEALLTWHTEDAFHPLRGDYVIFACLRNPYAAVTTIGSVEELALTGTTKNLLFEDRFVILPDESHRPHNNSDDGETDFAGIETMWKEPVRIPILFGDPARPYIRIDPYFMSVDDGDDEAASALAELVGALDAKMHDEALASGDVCFLDNFRIVHGRKPFHARFDGSDRWLKRVNVTRDLRKSRHVRDSATARSILS